MEAPASGPWGDTAAALAGLDQAPALTAVLEGPEHRVVALNGAMRELIGSRRPMGRPAPEVVPELLPQQAFAAYDDVYRTGQPFVGRDWRIELGQDDGSTRELYITFVLVPWRDDHGEILGLIGQAYDVTDEVTSRLHETHRAETAEDVVIAMQDALLPGTLPLLPGLDIAARYLIAAEEGASGGDWFDAVLRPDGRVALVVGDAVGHGVGASAVMGQLRAVLHAQLLDGSPVDDALSVLDGFARSTPAAHAATVCVVELDVASGDIEYCTAGHPPPLVVSGSGDARYLVPSGAGPLATQGRFPMEREQLRPDDLVLLYSDGAVERPRRTFGQNTAELAQVVGDTTTGRAGGARGLTHTVERVCEVTLELLTRMTGYDDDITLLAAQRVPRMAPLSLDLLAEPGVETRVREELDGWLGDLDVRLMDTIVVQHAVGELVSNVLDHAYRGGEPGRVLVEAQVDPRGMLVAAVTDTGRWREPDPAESDRGNGLALARGLADELSVVPGPRGTRAVVRHGLARPAQLMADQRTRSAARRQSVQRPSFAADVQGDWLVLSGPLDRDSAEDLRGMVLQAGHGGTEPVCVDLREVTHLGSAAVQVLHQLRRQGVRLTLLAPPGTVAQHVLELVSLPYQTVS